MLALMVGEKAKERIREEEGGGRTHQHGRIDGGARWVLLQALLLLHLHLPHHLLLSWWKHSSHLHQ